MFSNFITVYLDSLACMELYTLVENKIMMYICHSNATDNNKFSNIYLYSQKHEELVILRYILKRRYGILRKQESL